MRRSNTGYCKLLLLTFNWLIPALIAAQENCQLSLNKNGIEIYRCKLDHSPYDGVLVKFEASGRVQDYLDLATDVTRFDQWHYRAVDPQLIQLNDDSSFVFHSKVDTPWPLDPRDMVQQLTVKGNHQHAQVLIVGKPDFIPEEDGYIRIPYISSRMDARQVSESIIQFSYYAEAHPGGDIPAWVVNLFSNVGPMQTFQKLRELLSR